MKKNIMKSCLSLAISSLLVFSIFSCKTETSEITGIKLEGEKNISVGNTSSISFKKIPSDSKQELDYEIISGSDLIKVLSWKDGKLQVKGLENGTVRIRVYNDESNVSFFVDLNVTAGSDYDVAIVSPFFWGIWQRMDNGIEYEINENSVTINYTDSPKKTFAALDSNDESLSVMQLGTFTKQSASVIECKVGDIYVPLFRKGGSNLKYTMQIVGFENSRAVANVSGLKAKSKSQKYPSLKQETTSTKTGTITFEAKAKGDIQDISVESEDSIIVVPDVIIEEDGANMGTIPISTDGQYSLKVTGTIDKTYKEDGFLYARRTYPITISIKNISNVASAPSVYKITGMDERITVSGEEASGKIGTLEPNKTKVITSVNVYCESLTEAVLNSGLSVTITNAETGQAWKDCIPLRIFAKRAPITVSAKSPEGNASSMLNGFLIYPDGNSQFFTVNQSWSKTVYVPFFGKDAYYTLAFSGATIDKELSSSTEMQYTVNLGSTNAKSISTSDDGYIAAVQYGEGNGGNQTEDTAYQVQGNEFEAYLSKLNNDFYKIRIDKEVSDLN